MDNKANLIEQKIRRDVSLREFTTMQIGGLARYFVEVGSATELKEAFEWAELHKHKFFILGGGSNTVFSDEGFDGLIIRVMILGFEMHDHGEDQVDVTIGAGEDWDRAVAWTVNKNLSGLELLSLIPGNCGSAPVQNIGAYGQEFDQVFVSLKAFDTQTKRVVTLSKSDCGFSYRSSNFKTTLKNRYIITAVTLRLSRLAPSSPQYRDLMMYFTDHAIVQPTLEQIRSAVIAIRQSKIPDPRTVPNSGSFFKNPIVSRAEYDRILAKFPAIDEAPKGWAQAPRWFLPNSQVKLAAAWFIMTLGLRGYKHGQAQVDSHHALVLENTGQASARELQELRDIIIERVQKEFGITLETEPEIVS